MAPLRGDRHLRQRDAVLLTAFSSNDVTIFHVHGAAALRQMGGDDRVRAVGAKEDHLATAVLRHAGDDRIDRVQHRIAASRYVLHDDALQHRQVFHGGDVVQAQVVAHADVGHYRDLAAVEGQAFAQDAATRGFKHGRVDVRVQQHVARAAWTAAVATVGLAAFDVDAVGIGHARAQAAGGQQVRDQAHGGGLAVGAGHRHHWDATILARREHGVDDGLAHRAAFAERWRDVHTQARCGVDFHHAATLIFNWLQHVVAHHVHAAQIEANHLRRFHRARRHFRMHIVGDVGRRAAGRQVGVVTQDDALAFGRHGIRVQVLHGQTRNRDIVETYLGQRSRMTRTTARISVDDVDQLDAQCACRRRSPVVDRGAPLQPACCR